MSPQLNCHRIYQAFVPGRACDPFADGYPVRRPGVEAHVIIEKLAPALFAIALEIAHALHASKIEFAPGAVVELDASVGIDVLIAR